MKIRKLNPAARWGILGERPTADELMVCNGYGTPLTVATFVVNPPRVFTHFNILLPGEGQAAFKEERS